MNKEQSIEKIKSTLNELKELALSIKGKKELKFAEYPTTEGPVLVTSNGLEVGAEVFTKDAEGNQTPINDGEYTCEGKKLTIEGGKITKMEEIKEEDSVVSPEDNANVNNEKVEEKMNENIELGEDKKDEDKPGYDVPKPLEGEEDNGEIEIEVEKPEMEDRLKNLEEAVAKILSIMDQMMTKTEATMSENVELEKKVAELSAQPGDISVENKIKEVPENLSDVDLRIERFKRMAKSL